MLNGYRRYYNNINIIKDIQSNYENFNNMNYFYFKFDNNNKS